MGRSQRQNRRRTLTESKFTSTSSRLLIDEQPLQLMPSLAVAVGLNQAIFLQQLHYWLRKSDHFHDGRTWVYNTHDEWLEQFPFWSLRTLRRVVKALEDRGLVLSTREYNRFPLDQTRWYTIVYEELPA
jgi:hypothetical protein